MVGPYRTLDQDLIGSNVGNLVFSQAAYRLLSTKDARIDAQKIIGMSADRVNSSYDQVIVPLANAFRPAFVNMLRALTELFSQLTIPVVVMSVGVQGPVTGKIDPSPLDDVVKEFMVSVLNRSASVGVRGEVTAAYLKKLGFGDDVVDVTGCPSVFMDGPNLAVTKKVEELTTESRISLNISQGIAEMAPVWSGQAARYPNAMYTAQDRYTLELMLTGQYDSRAPHPAGSPTSMEHPLFAQNRVRFCLDPATWMRYLKQFDFSFGTRIHGNIMAILSGIPAVVLAHDCRTLELADYHQIPRRFLSRNPEDFDAAKLYAEADWAPTVAGHAARWERMAAFLERNGVRHVFCPGESPRDFDRKLAATHFPAPVEVGGTWLTRRETDLRRWVSAVRAKRQGGDPSEA